MPASEAQPIAVYHIEPEHFGSRGSRIARLMLNFAVFLVVLFAAEGAHNYLDKVMGLSRFSTFHTTQQVLIAAAMLSLPFLGSTYWKRRAQRSRLEVLPNSITQIKDGKPISFFPGNFGEATEERGLLSVPGFLISGYHAELFVPSGMPGYETAKEQIFAALQIKR